MVNFHWEVRACLSTSRKKQWMWLRRALSTSFTLKSTRSLVSICSHVTRELRYFPGGIQQTCIGRENLSRVQNLYFLSHLVIEFILYMDCNNRCVKTKTKGIVLWVCNFTCRTQRVYSSPRRESLLHVLCVCVRVGFVFLSVRMSLKANSHVSIFCYIFSPWHVGDLAVCLSAMCCSLKTVDA